jgi:hypothetical protein
MDFEQRLSTGKVGESLIAAWLRSQNWTILPVYDVEIDTGKGPRLYTPTRKLIAPDMLALQTGSAQWIEAKHKTAFSWHRNTGRWVTGIDKRHYADYCAIDDSTDWPVWLMFLQQGGQAKDSPPHSPSGLFGNALSVLRQNENHRFPPEGDDGMVYWSPKHLIKLASLEEVYRCSSALPVVVRKSKR